ncbi:hypothetical protein NQ317_012779 [Molorchus minor]|uniref:Fibronectin type-III domain-containing protein n=1 Tax=Molorchus minor TaxID=1323400 RepID=A0ABQ9K3D6_9CUCU|nr:hypothetical protein NQ317_012779 [Molorchus minor]
MSRSFTYSLVLVSCAAVIIAQTCRPTNVQNLQLLNNAVLTWEPADNENCSIVFYVVYAHSDGDIDHSYSVTDPSLNVSSLPLCQSIRFTVVAVSSDNINGPDTLLFDRMPLPSNANLSVAFVMVSEDQRGVHLQWTMDSYWSACADRFRVIIDDEDDDTVVDIYTRDYFSNITSLIPCTHYTFGVVALYNIVEEGPVTVVSLQTLERRMRAPVLESINLGTTSVDLTWRLQSVQENRCNVIELDVDASSFNVTQPIEDTPDREPISLTINGLQPGSLYLLNVTAVNSAGPSIPTLLGIQTLDN